MNVTRSRVALVADMDKLWAIGGYDGMKNLKTVSFYIFIADMYVYFCNVSSLYQSTSLSVSESVCLDVP